MTAVWVVLAVLVVLGGLGWLAVNRIKRGQVAANQVVPGVSTRAPASWAGSHDPEARLHRRLRDAMTSLNTLSTIDDGTLLTLRADIEQQALAVDDQLVATAALPRSQRGTRLTEAEKAVAAVEDAVGVFASAATRSNAGALDSSVTAVRQQLEVLNQVRAELPPAAEPPTPA